MKATGIIRRIDDLGRIVIPKEIRRTRCIQEGDPLELYVDGDSIIFRKYLPGTSACSCLDTIRDVIKDEMNVSEEVRTTLLQLVGNLETEIKGAEKQ